MIYGLIFVMLACLCWGLIFVVPTFLIGFSPLEISLGRYLFFGLISWAIIFLMKRDLLRKECLRLWGRSMWLSFTATLISYTCIVVSVLYANPAVTALIFGLGPLTIPLYGNWYRKEHPFKKFIIPGILMVIGLLCVNWNAFEFKTDSPFEYLLGVGAGFFGLAAWTWYAVANYHFVEKNKDRSPNDLVVMMGASTFILVLAVIGVLYLFQMDMTKFFIWTPDLKRFLMGSALLGVVSSWFGFLFWNYGNKRLSISLTGQLSIFEMIFGLIFSYIVAGRYPYPVELIGIIAMIAGVLAALKTLKKLSYDTLSLKKEVLLGKKPFSEEGSSNPQAVIGKKDHL